MAQLRNFCDLDLDAILLVAAFLEPVDITRLQCTCRFLRSTLRDEHLWRNLYYSRFKKPLPENANPQAAFASKLIMKTNWASKRCNVQTISGAQYTHYSSMQFAPRHPILCFAQANKKEITVWHLVRQKKLRTLPGERFTFCAVTGDMIICSPFAKTVSIWNPDTDTVATLKHSWKISITAVAAAHGCFYISVLDTLTQVSSLPQQQQQRTKLSHWKLDARAAAEAIEFDENDSTRIYVAGNAVEAVDTTSGKSLWVCAPPAGAMGFANIVKGFAVRDGKCVLSVHTALWILNAADGTHLATVDCFLAQNVYLHGKYIYVLPSHASHGMKTVCRIPMPSAKKMAATPPTTRLCQKLISMEQTSGAVKMLMDSQDDENLIVCCDQGITVWLRWIFELIHGALSAYESRFFFVSAVRFCDLVIVRIVDA
eukprot:TRINITY_DN3234_c0_g1_i9.p1 TRINITY_DN3234_c0_g1~~TRINITY_DN3234_c0_g1_i9.p1  ORF type:complete len:427 (-),score=52.25 TRINITY_DN3234_c0_g1_i9:562-1842(-)